jgi:Raf kinase inhibitor-like YbhB/YbcL family protein
MSSFAVNSPAFSEGSTIPKKYTLDGENISPPVKWVDPPQGTRSFAILCEDPDAPSGTFRHWAMCNIGADQTGLSEGFGTRPDGEFAQNDFGHARYDGPRPPQGHGLHHYHFRVAALDTDHIEVSPEQNAVELWRAVQPHILAQAETVGTYQR